MRLFAVLGVAGLVALSGCSSGNNGGSSGSGSIVVTGSLTKADVDAGNSFTVSYDITGDPKSQGLKVSLSGPGSASTAAYNILYGYVTTYTAPSSVTAGSTATITAASNTDSSKNVTTVVTLHDAINYQAQTPPAATAGKAYSYTFQASGGTGTLTFSVTQGSGNLPTGLSLSSAGVLSGTPSAVGSYTFGVLVGDQATKPIGISRSYTIQVN